MASLSYSSSGQQTNHFTGNIPTKESSILTGKLFVNGRQVKNDFEIGVFINNQGSEILVGACVIGDKIVNHYYVNVYGDLPETPIIEGPVYGDELIIKIWNPLRIKQDYYITLIYEPVDGLARPEIPPVWYGDVTQGFLNIYARDKNAPVISKIQNQYTMEDITASPISFIAFDPHTYDLTLTIQSSNQTLIPENNIQRRTSDIINHELIITPAQNQYGQSVITITASNPEGLTDETLFYLTVIPENDAPILAQGTSLTIASIDEDTTDYNGISIQSLISNLDISDIDPLSKQGIAVYAVDDTFGGWQYSINDGETWSHFHAIPNSFFDMSRMSRLLDASENHRIRFIPDANCSGITNLYFRAWDQSTGIPGKTANTKYNGATTAFSSETGIATIQVYPVNDFPQISNFDDLTIYQDKATEAVLLTMTDIETPADQLKVTFASSNPHVVTISNIKIAPGKTSNEKYITISVSGKMTPKPYIHPLPVGIYIGIHLIHENSGEHCSITVVTNDQYGHFNLLDYDGFNKLGNWSIQASLSDHLDYQDGQSQMITVKVIENEGYAILLQGYLDNNQGADTHYKTLTFVYDTLIDRDLDPDDIYCFSNYASDSRIDGIPNENTISDVLNHDILNKMNVAPSNVYIILIDHGINELFYIGRKTISHTQLAGWINDFQNKLENEDAKKQEIVCILGFCHSGSFVKSLSGENRIIITSSDTDEDSFKGPVDRDNVREGEFFVSEFFKQVALGMNIRSCFEEAVIQTELYTYSVDKWPSFPFNDHALQHPLLDDDSDGFGSNILSDLSGDGILSENIFIGAGKNLTNDSSRISIIHVSKTQFIEYDMDQLDTLQACEDNPDLFSSSWIQIKPPTFQPYSENHEEQLELNFENIPGSIHNNCATWENLTFEHPGLYQIFYFAKDINGNITSDMSSRVYKRIEYNSPPFRFKLLKPANYNPEQNDFQNTVRTSVLLEWEYKNVQNEDPFDYTILLSKGNYDFNDPIEISGIETNFYYLTSLDGIEDMTIYYWKVRAIDTYGEFYETSPWAFQTNNYANIVTGFIKGCIVEKVSRQVISHAIVNIRTPLKNLNNINGFYRESLDAGTYIIDISACGFQSLTDNIYIDQDKIT